MKIFLLLSIHFFISLTSQDDRDNFPKSFWRIAESVWKTESSQMTFKDLSIFESGYKKGVFYKVSNNQQLIGYLYIGKCNTCRSGGCKNIKQLNFAEGDYEYFKYFMLLDNDFKILQVKIFDYQATHGHEIMNKFWLSKFKGYNVSKTIVYGKNIDAISGATVSAESLIFDIEYIISLVSTNHIN